MNSDKIPVQQLIDHLLTAVLVLDGQLRIQYLNAAAETLLDGSRKRLLQVPFYSHFSYLSIDQSLLFHALTHQQSVSDSEVVMVLHDQQRLTVEFSAQYLNLDDEAQPQLLIELRRVDQQRKITQENSQQQQRHAAQTLVRGLAHEIKNPLGGLRGAAQLLAAELPDAQLRDYTDLIINQADRLRNLVDRLLGPNQLPERHSQNLHELLERVIRVVSLDAESVSTSAKRQLTIQKDYDPSLPEMVMAGDALEQALLNILVNAGEAMQGDGTIRVRTRVVHQETIYGKRYRQCAIISITDDGPGIPLELSETLFYPMVSGHAGGTGLGLSIAQTVVHQHAGKIEVDSMPGHTEFRIYLPYEQTRVADERTEERL